MAPSKWGTLSSAQPAQVGKRSCCWEIVADSMCVVADDEEEESTPPSSPPPAITRRSKFDDEEDNDVR